MISIVIPTFNNLDYLKLCIQSIKKNSRFNHEIKLHVNDGSDGTLEYAKNNKILFTYSKQNIGLCSAINKICETVDKKYILYAHDDMYFCPSWDRPVTFFFHNSLIFKKKYNAFFLVSAINV